MGRSKKRERGSTLLEFAIGATVFLTAMFAVLEFGRALWIHNALADAARRGARYAVINVQDEAKVKNVVVYGDEDGGTKPLVDNLGVGNVSVNYSGFEMNKGTVSITITNYEFQFVLPFLATSIQMPGYTTTLTAESAGLVPASK
jgi:TadE-like protein